jgi:predicted AlkP superfamily phosphohydrolase/phosphomutase
MNPSAKIVFLAMDAGDKFLIQNWARDGTLPTMHSLLARGLVGETMSVEGLYEGSTWPSFYTGVTPARHGFHRLTQINPGTYEFYRCYPGEFIKREPFWNHLSSAGRKVAILDIPLSGISKGLNGIQMVEWGSHDGVYGFHTWPRELKGDVIKRFGNHPMKKSCDSYRRSPQDFCRFRDHLIEGVKKKCELTIHYMNKGEWGFFAQVFTEGHCAGHQCWHLHDPAHPNYDRKIVSLTGDPIREVYRAIDSAIGRILAHVDENTLVFFLATHRMAHNVGGDFLLEKILEKLNLLKKWPAAAPLKQQGMIKQIHNVAKGQWQKLPNPVKATLKPALFPLYNSAKRWVVGEDLPQISSRMDLKHCKCFPHENGNLISGIRINLLEREPSGLIKPGKELKDFCQELSEDLLNIVDRDSGKPMVKRVIKTSDFLEGEYIDHLPDLLVEWNEDKLIGSKGVSDDKSCWLQLTSEKIGMVEGEYTYCRTGDHRPEGLFIVFGPGINPGAIGRTISIMDFAPTFLNLFGLTIPDLDGKPISEILGKESSLSCWTQEED